jgi:hypothetical protein
MDTTPTTIAAVKMPYSLQLAGVIACKSRTMGRHAGGNIDSEKGLVENLDTAHQASLS